MGFNVLALDLGRERVWVPKSRGKRRNLNPRDTERNAIGELSV